jgi:uncharacterized membrane-anchored protein
MLLACLLAGLPAALRCDQAWSPVTGPAHVTLGAEAQLELPQGWSFVPKDQLPAYFSPGPRRAGAWDLGVALGPDSGAPELRLQFEPMGAVDDRAGLEEPLALLARVQQAMDAENARRGLQGQAGTLVSGWSQAPAYELGAHRLLFGELRSSNGEDLAAWRLRLNGRAGVLKIDLVTGADRLANYAAAAAGLAEGLSFLPGRGLDAAQDSDRRAALDLNALVLDAVAGRGTAGPLPRRDALPLAVSATLALALGLAIVSGALGLYRWVRAWNAERGRLAAKERETRRYERELGASADEVVLVEDGEDGA